MPKPNILSKKQKQQMKKLREQELSHKKIAEELGVSENTVMYHLNPKHKEEIVKHVKKWRKTKKGREWHRNYRKKRYREDPRFRERTKELHRKSLKRYFASEDAPRRNKPWSLDEIEFMVRHLHESDFWVARKLGRPVTGVGNKRRELGYYKV